MSLLSCMPLSPHAEMLSWMDARREMHASADAGEANIVYCAMLCALHHATVVGGCTSAHVVAGAMANLCARVVCFDTPARHTTSGNVIAEPTIVLATSSPWYVIATRLEVGACQLFSEWMVAHEHGEIQTEADARPWRDLARACIGTHHYLRQHVGPQLPQLVLETRATWRMLEGHVLRLRGLGLWLSARFPPTDAPPLATRLQYVGMAARATQCALTLPPLVQLRLDATEAQENGFFHRAAECYRVMQSEHREVLTEAEVQQMQRASRHPPDPQATPPRALPELAHASSRILIVGASPLGVYDFNATRAGRMQQPSAWT